MPANFLRTTRSKLGAVGGATRSRNLNFSMQHQQQTNWCWSAVATSTSLFYSTASQWTQCELANQELNQTTCCQDGSTTQCNQDWFLDRALTRTSNLLNWATGTISFAVLRQQIDSQRAVGVRIGWNTGGGHFVVLDGYNTINGQSVSVRDPWYGDSTYTYSSFSTQYQGTGSWTHTYKTKP